MSVIAVSIRNLWYFRNIVPVVEELARRGHRVQLIAEHEGDFGQSGSHAELDRLLAAYPNLEYLQLEFKKLKPKQRSRWFNLDLALSLAIDKLHFAGPVFDRKPFLRKRSEAKAQGPLLALLDTRLFRTEWGRRLGLRVLRRLAEAMPPKAELAKAWRKRRPDLLVLCPLIDVARPQFDQVRAARELAIPTALFVHSWDNLSSKSWIRREPDVTLVWNEAQKQEIAEFHGLPTANVRVSGAPHYDEWFERKPEVSRDQFLAELGFDPGEKTILFVSSAIFEPPLSQHSETEFLTEWVEAIRAAPSPAVRNANLIVRPHPKRQGFFAGLDFSRHERVRIWPSDSDNPVSGTSRSTYFHSLVHSDAVVGLNTSAFLEAAILRRPVFTVLDPRYAVSQQGTFHLEWLLGSETSPGVIRAARAMDEHLAGLARCLSGQDPFRAEEEAFIVGFVRPNGRDKPATAIACDAIEAAARQKAPALGRGEAAMNAFLRGVVLRAIAPLGLATRRRVRPKKPKALPAGEVPGLTSSSPRPEG